MASHRSVSRPAALASLAAVALLATAGLTGCGGSPSPEPDLAASPELPPSPAPPPEGTGQSLDESASVEQPWARTSAASRSYAREASIRTHLADRFLFASWYPRLREVVVRGEVATVSATLPSRSGRKAIASKLCTAVLSSGQVGRVRVRDEEGASIACP